MSTDDARSSVPERSNRRSTKLSKASYVKALAFNGHTKLRRIEGQLITASEFRDRSGLTSSLFMKLVKRGELVAVGRNVAGWALYHEADVARISEKFKGQLGIVARREGLFEGACEYTTTEAYEIMSRLKKNMPMHEIFLETKLHPVIIQSVQRDWARMHQGMFLSKDDLDDINKLPLEGSFPITTPRELYEVLLIASKDKPCGQCNQRPRSGTCLSCARKAIYAAKRSERMRKEGVPVEVEEPTMADEDHQ